jgi:two-component sensor histidine kinase
VDLAIPIGLILNELVTNSFKYAYQQVPDPTLEIKFKTEGGIYLKVKDNGVGIDMDKWNSKGRRSFGKQLIVSLSKQVSGQYKVEMTVVQCLNLPLFQIKRQLKPNKTFSR